MPMGFPDGMYRVGPLARLNVAEQMGTPKADAELKKFKKMRPHTAPSLRLSSTITPG